MFVLSRAKISSLNKSHLEEDVEKVTRETAAYNRLDAVLRVTKPLCEKQTGPIDDILDDNGLIKTSKNILCSLLCVDLMQWFISRLNLSTMVRIFL